MEACDESGFSFLRKRTGRLLTGACVMLALLVWSAIGARGQLAQQTTSKPVLTGQAALTDWHDNAPLVRRRIVRADVPAPFSSDPSDNVARIYPRPAGAWPQAPAGFKVDLFAEKLGNPRQMKTAPNGDIFIADSQWGRIRVLRASDGATHAARSEIFATGLKEPFGLAFYPPGPNPRWLYVGDTDALLRLPYHNGDLKASGAPQKLLDLPPLGAHWSRDVVFSRDGRKLYVSVGSGTNYGGDPKTDNETRRADILIMKPDGTDVRVYASGIRNAVGLAVDPRTGSLWCSTNERDGLGDNLPPDYVTKVKLGGFYGWPWFFTGGFQDPRSPSPRMEMKSKTLLPDVLIAPHSASLGLTFYEGKQFPREYRHSLFAAEHGSSNRSRFTGYKVIFVPVVDGAAVGDYMDFVTGFVAPGNNGKGRVWGRPVGVTVAHDGALLVSDDASNSVWRVSYPAP